MVPDFTQSEKVPGLGPKGWKVSTNYLQAIVQAGLPGLNVMNS